MARIILGAFFPSAFIHKSVGSVIQTKKQRGTGNGGRKTEDGGRLTVDRVKREMVRLWYLPLSLKPYALSPNCAPPIMPILKSCKS